MTESGLDALTPREAQEKRTMIFPLKRPTLMKRLSLPRRPYRPCRPQRHPTDSTQVREPWQRMLALLLGLLIVLGGLIGLGAAAWAEDTDKNDLSLYAVSSGVTGYFASALKPGENRAISDSWQALADSPATGGAFMGYADKDLNPVEWLVSQATSASQAIEFGSLSKLGDGVRHYAQFGATLSQLGLDATSTGLSGSLLSWVGGLLIIGPFTLASGINVVFGWFLQLLTAFNPFKLLYGGVQAVAPKFAEAVLAGGGAPDWQVLGIPIPMEGLASFIGGIYQAVNDLSWAVLVPLFIGLTAFMIIFSRNRGSLFKKLLVRVVFIVIGIPLLGSMYTGVLNQLGEVTKNSDSAATQVVASTFVDFEKWAGDYRLAVPSGAVIEWDAKKSQATMNATVHVQDTALAINKMTHPEWASLTNPFSLTNPGDFVSGAQGNDAEGASTAVGMIQRYMDMNGKQFTSSAYASRVQSVLTKQDEGKTAAKWFTDLRTDGGGWFGIGATDPGSAQVGSNRLLTVGDGYGLGASTTGDIVTFTSAGASGNCGADPNKQSCSMSVLAMYNYLNARFDTNSLTTYSTNKAASAATAEAHNAVTLVGTGFGSVVYWANAFVLLISFVVIGIGYAVAMFIGNIKQGVQVITAVPFAMMGALGAVTKVIVFAVAMVLELIVTIFLYKIVQLLLLSLSRIFASFLSGVGDVLGGAFAASPAIALLVPLLTTIIITAFTIMALRVRRSIVRALNEVCTKIIEMLIGGNSPTVPGGKSGALAAAAGGIGAGAGMALGSRMMGGDRVPKAAEAGGPEKVSASGTINTSSADEGGGNDTVSGDGTSLKGGPDPSGRTGGSIGGVSQTELTGQNSSDRGDQEMGERVARVGLTAIPAAITADSSGSDGADGEEGADSEEGVGGEGGMSEQAQKKVDVLDSAFEAGEDHHREQKSIDRQKRGAVAAGVAGVGKAAMAVGRVHAGDLAGAVSDARGALGSVQKARSKAQDAKQRQRQLDQPGAGSGGKSSSQLQAPQGQGQSRQARTQPQAQQSVKAQPQAGRGQQMRPQQPPTRQPQAPAPVPPQQRSQGQGQGSPQANGSRSQGLQPRRVPAKRDLPIDRTGISS